MICFDPLFVFFVWLAFLVWRLSLHSDYISVRFLVPHCELVGLPLVPILSCPLSAAITGCRQWTWHHICDLFWGPWSGYSPAAETNPCEKMEFVVQGIPETLHICLANCGTEDPLSSISLLLVSDKNVLLNQNILVSSYCWHEVQRKCIKCYWKVYLKYCMRFSVTGISEQYQSIQKFYRPLPFWKSVVVQDYRLHQCDLLKCSCDIRRLFSIFL